MLCRVTGTISMQRNKLTFDTVRGIGLGFPDVEESTTYGSPSLKYCGRLLTCLAVHKSAEPGSLAVRIGFDQRAALMAGDPDIYYLTDHYVNYPVVLVRLSRIRVDALRKLLVMAFHFVRTETPDGRRMGRRQKKPPAQPM
ncbi:MAG: hypothetical protein DMG08_16950 [Acidobacteria bacterium]|nr:MAG: hypothetical protein DMG08_16950 [Acidobacteriota bacterium]